MLSQSKGHRPTVDRSGAKPKRAPNRINAVHHAPSLAHIFSALLRLPDSNLDSNSRVSSSAPRGMYQRGMFSALVAPLASCHFAAACHVASCHAITSCRVVALSCCDVMACDIMSSRVMAWHGMACRAVTSRERQHEPPDETVIESTLSVLQAPSTLKGSYQQRVINFN